MSALPCEIQKHLRLLLLSTSLWASALPAADPAGSGPERAIVIGGETDIAFANAEVDWSELQQRDLPAIIANMDVGHGATYSQSNGGPFASGPLTWLQWQLRDDAQARAKFSGNDCGYCTGSDWDLRRHNID